MGLVSWWNTYQFVACNGWFEKFKTRHSLHNLKFHGEKAFADATAAKEYPAKLVTIIQEKVFKADEKGLYVEKMPIRTLSQKL